MSIKIVIAPSVIGSDSNYESGYALELYTSTVI